MPRETLAKILVIEDDPFTQDLLREELQESGYDMQFLSSGKDAVATAIAGAPDLVLLDIMMPGVDGYAVCAALRKDTRMGHVPIIFMTAKGATQDLTRGLAVGANDYIVKPFNMEVLIARIETQLRTKQLMDQVDKQNKELEVLNARIKEFLSMASHDLRTPASVIKLAASTLLDEVAGPLNDMQKNLLQKLAQQINYMNQLLNDLLSLAHIESGKIVLQKTQEDLNTLLQANVSSLRMLAESKSIQVALEADATLPRVSVDKTRFMQIMDNIVSNAIKYTASGGKITVKTSWSGVAKPAWAFIWVLDTGVGMEPADLAKLFQEFSSGGAKPTKGEKSTGLGLSIAKKLTELHHGKLEVSSKVGVGTEFLISLPL